MRVELAVVNSEYIILLNFKFIFHFTKLLCLFSDNYNDDGFFKNSFINLYIYIFVFIYKSI